MNAQEHTRSNQKRVQVQSSTRAMARQGRGRAQQNGKFVDQQVIAKGATVRNLAGDRIGEVITSVQDTFIVGTGRSEDPEYSVRYSDIAEIRNGDIVLRQALDDLRRRDQIEEPRYYEGARQRD